MYFATVWQRLYLLDMDFSALETSAELAAQRLLGCEFVRDIAGQTVRVRIVETEAYDQTDTASHSYKGRTPRTEIMFGPAGFLYVYFTYGMHYCMNIVTSLAGEGSAVLIRAVEPIEGIDVLRANRPNQSDKQLANGPAKLCQALQINKSMNGHNLKEKPLKLILNPLLPSGLITQTTRIGISQAATVPWRFYLTGNSFVSKT